MDRNLIYKNLIDIDITKFNNDYLDFFPYNKVRENPVLVSNKFVK
jgi:hypothetical protein